MKSHVVYKKESVYGVASPVGSGSMDLVRNIEKPPAPSASELTADMATFAKANIRPRIGMTVESTDYRYRISSVETCRISGRPAYKILMQ